MTAGRFDGKAALLTAAASGIGAATARRLAAEGAQVLVTDLDDAAGQVVVDKITADGGQARYRHCDVTNPVHWSETVAELHAWTGRVDVLHLNAGGNTVGSVDEITEETWTAQLRFGLDSAYFGLHATLPLLRESQGAVVMTSSIHAHVGFRGYPAYAAAKGAIEALVRQLAVDYGPDGVRVNAVAPGAVLTGMWTNTTDDHRHEVAERTPLRRIGVPADIAAVVAFLASDDAAFVTGQVLLADGGRSITSNE